MDSTHFMQIFTLLPTNSSPFPNKMNPKTPFYQKTHKNKNSLIHSHLQAEIKSSTAIAAAAARRKIQKVAEPWRRVKVAFILSFSVSSFPSLTPTSSLVISSHSLFFYFHLFSF